MDKHLLKTKCLNVRSHISITKVSGHTDNKVFARGLGFIALYFKILLWHYCLV